MDRQKGGREQLHVPFQGEGPLGGSTKTAQGRITTTIAMGSTRNYELKSDIIESWRVITPKEMIFQS